MSESSEKSTFAHMCKTLTIHMNTVHNMMMVADKQPLCAQVVVEVVCEFL